MDQRPPPPPHTPHGPRVHHDALAARPVFVAPQRSARPDDADLAAGGGDPGAWCPFCAGNESRTPPHSLRTPADPALPWRARIVANGYPIVMQHAEAAAAAADRPARGVHDVVIESATHERSILALDAVRPAAGAGEGVSAADGAAEIDALLGTARGEAAELIHAARGQRWTRVVGERTARERFAGDSPA